MVVLGAKGVQSEDDLQNDMKPLPGRYHVVVRRVDESFQNFDKIVIDFKVLAGTTPGQEGRCIPAFIGTKENEIPRLTRLAIVTGLLKPGDPEQEISLEDARGKQLVIEVVENKYTNKQGREINTVQVEWFGFWSLTNKEVSDVPKNQDMIKKGAQDLLGQNQEDGNSDSGDGQSSGDWNEIS